jgi:hypothetical protein
VVSEMERMVMPGVEMGRSQISRANQRCRQPDSTSLVARGFLGGGGLCDMIGWMC